jgi:Tfp pilus assembly protein PilF
LAAFYPHPGELAGLDDSAGAVSAAAGAIELRGVASIEPAGPPWPLAGFWYLGTLVPVIGIAQVGAQAMADRYSYIPLLGVFSGAVWLAGDALTRRPSWRIPISAAASVILVACLWLTHRQSGVWRDSLTLHRHSIAVGVDSATTRFLHAIALRADGRPQAEISAEYERALVLDPTYINALTSLAVIALNGGQIEQAARMIDRTHALEPSNPSVYQNLAAFAALRGQPDLALKYFADGLKLKPNFTALHRDLAQFYTQRQQFAEAAAEWETVIRLTPWDYEAWTQLGAVRAAQQRLAEARECTERALWINPAFAPASRNLQALMQRQLAVPPPPAVR